MVPETFETHPSRYRHWQPTYDGAICRLAMNVTEDAPLVPGYQLKLNSYDLGVDLELADFVQRLRFEHPEVRVVVLASAKERVFCAGANIRMLAASSHPFKVNFCKFTNETRLAIEDACAHSDVTWVAALNGTCAGGGYELALACDEIILVEDGASAVSLPEVPLLGVLPGTGGLTRVVDKRRVRRDRADVFSTLAEGIKGKRAADWKLVDHVVPRSRFDVFVNERAQTLVAEAPASTPVKGISLEPLEVRLSDDAIQYTHVDVKIDRARRSAELTIHAPKEPLPQGLEAIVAAGSRWWPLRAFRELDDALLRLRFHNEEINILTLHSRGDQALVLEADRALLEHAAHPFVREVLGHTKRTLRRLDLMAKSLFAVLDERSCFAGTLLEVALAADRRYLLSDEKHPVAVSLNPINGGLLRTFNGSTRLDLLAGPEQTQALTAGERVLDAAEADEAGLATVASDEIDFSEELRVAIEERASLSPDALTGMEANLRCVGPENEVSKIFGRLTAWQNWIFTRPNSTGPHGALTQYGKPEKPQFDWRRT